MNSLLAVSTMYVIDLLDHMRVRVCGCDMMDGDSTSVHDVKQLLYNSTTFIWLMSRTLFVMFVSSAVI
jgi:hypothetical protein